MSRALTFPPAPPRPTSQGDGHATEARDRELGPFEAEGALRHSLELSMLCLAIAGRLHLASVSQAYVNTGGLTWEQLPAATQQFFREHAECAIRQLDAVTHRLAVVEADRMLARGQSFEVALNAYQAALLRPRR